MEKGIDCGFPCNACPPACAINDIQDGDETGVDCDEDPNTPCPSCFTGPTCNDGIQNGTETGVDCGDLETGGLACGPCPDPTCNDGIQNIHIELTDVVEAGYLVVVETGVDCDDSPLTSCPDCPIPTCFDGIQNGTEEGIDCGGGCGNACDPTPSCSNGFQDGNETGIDCDDDPATNCPPCPICGDEIKNGPELEPDCVDYPIPEYPCIQCPSCYDNDLTAELYELDVDCGGDCDDCPQFLRVESIGIGTGGAPAFQDQYSYNLQLAEFGNTDTLELDHNLYPGLSIEKVSGLYNYIEVIAHQGFETDNGLYIRRVELQLPYPEELGIDNPRPFLLSSYSVPLPGTCGPTGIPGNVLDLPVIFYSEFLVGGNTNFNRCFFLVDLDTDFTTLVYNYLNGTPQAGEYLTKGSVDGGELYYITPPPDNTAIEGSFENLEFEFQYSFF
jgi:hypothetical protein